MPLQVGTTTLLSHFLAISVSVNESLQEGPHNLHTKVIPLLNFKQQEGKRVGNIFQLAMHLKKEGYFSFSFVRHPFER